VRQFSSFFLLSCKKIYAIRIWIVNLGLRKETKNTKIKTNRMVSVECGYFAVPMQESQDHLRLEGLPAITACSLKTTVALERTSVTGKERLALKKPELEIPRAYT
jgi:hypothetical protein